MDPNKKNIIDLFYKKVKGKNPKDLIKKKHDGAEGHWLDLQFGKLPDGDNNADHWGYECKSGTTSGKTTWGDWQANYYIYKDPKYNITREDFFQYWGHPNHLKANRLSWSGKIVPAYHEDIKDSGQFMYADGLNDIYIKYDYEIDNRINKASLIPEKFKKKNLILAKWIGYEKNLGNYNGRTGTLEKRVESKFNQKGWFICKRVDGIYTSIIFGEPIDFNIWMQMFKQKKIFFDSGMYDGNNRPYSQFRSDNRIWSQLNVIDEYK